ncbi:plastocyanin/azurin family copper-binding protein [Halorussus salinus]|uniref:plastocyanin/azurin family copper-binding protein n=1 Tax=Halorussus salinus TaxID=1364935 RepID=UPI0010923B42|nr:plastocyanin/azurin family copper-binding protein [Halorussus salinus]
MSRNRRPDRRTVLKTSGVVLATGALSGCLAGGQGSPDGSATDTEETPTPSDSATTDSETTTDSDGSTATVEVGPGGEFTFAPSGDRPLVVAPGTTVEFVWKSDNHNVVVDDQPDDADWEGTPDGPGTVYERGYSLSHTFEEPGRYAFHCAPHESIGMRGTIFVTPEDATAEFATADDLPVEVGPNDELTFSPGTDRPLSVATGTEVPFVWKSDDHNVVVESQPDDADWEGTAGDATTLYDEGHEYSHTFETAGTYRFYCQAHRSAGMVATIVVEDE